MMDLMSILMLIITYTLIGFGFACGFALFRWVSKKWRQRKLRNKADGTPHRLVNKERFRRL
jgi:hypothetical protein